MGVCLQAAGAGRPALLATRPRPCLVSPASVDSLGAPLGPPCLNSLHFPHQFWTPGPVGKRHSPLPPPRTEAH